MVDGEEEEGKKFLGGGQHDGLFKTLIACAHVLLKIWTHGDEHQCSNGDPTIPAVLDESGFPYLMKHVRRTLFISYLCNVIPCAFASGFTS